LLRPAMTSGILEFAADYDMPRGQMPTNPPSTPLLW
jgi:hypothetical protein